MLTKSRKWRGGIRLGEVGLAVIVLLALGYAANFQRHKFSNREFRSGVYRQKIKLPDSHVLQWITLGYDNIYADWLWLQSIQNFGAGWITENNTTEPIFQYFDTMTDVDPHFVAAYEFGNLIIGDQRRDFASADRLLQKGIYKNPNDYQLPFLGLYAAIWDTGDLVKARFYSNRLRRIPDTPNFMKRLEEYIERKSGRLAAAFDINARYYIEYLSTNNNLEREIMHRRIQTVLDKWYSQQFAEAIERYVAANGTHPRKMEELLTQEYLPPYEAPTIRAFEHATTQGFELGVIPSGLREVPDELVEAVVKASQETIAGLPPEPYGYWYYIYTPYRNGFEEHPDKYAQFEAPYVVSAKELFDRSGEVVADAVGRIFMATAGGGEPLAPGALESHMGRDFIGGHYVYDPDKSDDPTKMFWSTGRERILSGGEPRMGLSGPGPFPMKLEPGLYDFPAETAWGRESGYISPEGIEFWVHPDRSAAEAAATERPFNTNDGPVQGGGGGR